MENFERVETSFLQYTENQSEHLSQTSTLVDLYFKHRSPFQDIQVVETLPFGKVLVLDGKTQSAQVDEKIYHESLVHPPMLACSNPETVFIGGGGELATAREVLRHSSVKRVVMVDLDQAVVDISRERLPEWGEGATEDPRLELHYEDAMAYLKDHDEKFDVIIMDIADPIEAGPGIGLYTQEFYEFAAHQRMNPGGVFVTQSGSAGLLYYHECFAVINKTLASVFDQVHPYLIEIPSFASSWGFNVAFFDSPGAYRNNMQSMEAKDIDALLAERVSGAKSLFHYDGESHHGMFHVPKYLRRALEAESRVMTKDNLVCMY